MAPSSTPSSRTGLANASSRLASTLLPARPAGAGAATSTSYLCSAARIAASETVDVWYTSRSCWSCASWRPRGLALAGLAGSTFGGDDAGLTWL